ncbi:MAG TPA: ABC transporter substrate-binding protein [Miltoncostaeaceae bacterium]|nr:ABC transporter substrate-binding protein [Miltoncostaeaceae bacterium]
MRIASLLPSATEMVAAVGLADRLVGRTHECDWPPEVAGVPPMTADRLDRSAMNSAEIDRAVGEAMAEGGGLYRLDAEALAAARPDLIITQALCGVCAVERDEVEEAARGIASRPAVLSLEPETLEGVLDCMLLVGEAAGAAGPAARAVAALRRRLDRARALTEGREPVRAVCLEWLDPPYLAGHWVPEQVELAGGHDPLGRPGRPSVAAAPRIVIEADPDALLLMPCGWTASETLAALARDGFHERYGGMRAVREGRVTALDGGAHFSRPGPRLVDGVEALVPVLHPEAVAAPAAARG